MSNFTKPKGMRSNGVPFSTQISAKADREVAENGDSTYLKTYAAHIRLDYPCPSPKTATTRMVGDKFVWERLYQTKGRGNAVVQASKWFMDLRLKGGVGKILQDKEVHECVVIDDPWNECSYGSEFNNRRPLNRLLDEETKERVIEESKGNLRVSNKPFEKGEAHPSLEWIDGAKRIDDSPIKVGLNSLNPSPSMKDSIDNAVERAKTRKKNKQESWFKEVHNQDIRKLVDKMRKNGTIEHSSAYRKRVGKKAAKQKVVAKKKVSARQKEVLKAEIDEWIAKEEKNSLKRRKNKS